MSDVNKITGLTPQEYNEASSGMSKQFVFMFLIFCLYFWWFQNVSLGNMWIVYIIAGILISSMFFALPCALLIFFICFKTNYKPHIVFFMCYPFKWSWYVLLFFSVKYSLYWLE